MAHEPGAQAPKKGIKKPPERGGEHDEAGTDEARAGSNADSLTEPGAPRPDHGAIEGRGAGNKGSSHAQRAPGSESGSRIAPRRLRRSALRSAAGEWQCSYTPAPLRSLYGLVARLTQYAYLIPPENGHRNREHFTRPPIRGRREYSHAFIIMPCLADVNPGAGLAPRRLRRSAPRSAAGEWQCSYTPAPLRSLYGLVARLTQREEQERALFPSLLFCCRFFCCPPTAQPLRLVCL